MSTAHLTDLAHDLVAHGFAGHEQAVRAIARLARQHAVAAALVDVLADPRQPEPARLRAFGRVAVALDAVWATGGARAAA